jgi:hypothetical protein
MTHENYPYASPPGTRVWQPALLPSHSNAEPLIATAASLPADPLCWPRLAGIVAVAIAIASVANATMAPVMTAMRPGSGFAPGLAYLSLVLGSIAGQAAVLTVLAVWASGPLWLRLVWHWGLMLLAFAAWTFGFVVALISENQTFPDEEFRIALLGLPLVALAFQAVPWLFKLYLGWRIVHDEENWESATDQQLSIRDMFLATVVVAISMAAVRLGKPANVEEGIYWAAWGIGGAVASAISLVCLVPMVYLMLGVRDVRWGVLGVVAMATSWAALAAVILMWLQFSGPSDKEIMLITASIAAGFTLTLAGMLRIARASGYRLVRHGLSVSKPG